MKLTGFIFTAFAVFCAVTLILALITGVAAQKEEHAKGACLLLVFSIVFAIFADICIHIGAQ